jgi:D-glycero-D-manno-heptose 1,7-bisphosphate phosphatase
MAKKHLQKFKRVIFLDRDGVINRFPGHGKYVTSLAGFRLIPRSIQAIRLLYQAGFTLYVITNQGGVSKRLYTRKTLDAMTRRMRREIRRAGGRLSGVFCCPHSSELNCLCRKPRTTLLEKATRRLRVDKKNSYFIGDSLVDVKAGRAFGVKTILVLSGSEKKENASAWDAQPDFIAKDLLASAKNILAGQYERA